MTRVWAALVIGSVLAMPSAWAGAAEPAKGEGEPERSVERAPARDEATSEYTLGRADVVQVQVYGEPELSKEVVIDDTCRIMVALVGRVDACERTPAAVEQELEARLSDGILEHPHVAVSVVAYRSQRVDVLGAVENTGPIYLKGPTTVLDVVSEAGGPSGDNVVQLDLVRRNGSAETYSIPELVTRAEPVRVFAGDKVVLKPGEVVYVEGEVARPGAVVAVDGITVARAIALAGGPKEYASLVRVLVRHADGSRERVNVKRIQRGRAADVPLTPDDHVLVPQGGF